MAGRTDHSQIHPNAGVSAGAVKRKDLESAENPDNSKREKLASPNSDRRHKPTSPNAIKAQTGSIANNGVSKLAIDFKALGVDPWLVKSLKDMAITRPTGIQASCIPKIIGGSDCIGGSRTGSGKTVAFAVPMLQQWARDPSAIYGIVLTPTRELALQIFEQFKALAAPQSFKPVLITGGADMRQQALQLAERPHIVVATPGRLADHIKTSGEDTVGGLRRVRVVVLDEADRLLASGPGSMIPDLDTCMSLLPSSNDRQTLLFTATVTPEIRTLQDLPRPPKRSDLFVCEIDTAVLAIPNTLKQFYLLAPVTHREVYLHILLLTPQISEKSVIIFTNRTDTADFLAHMLHLLDHKVTALHSKLSQSERTANLSKFRASSSRILVATDVASRGLDIPDVGLVINYDIPREPDVYIHRVGRTARAGKQGHAISIIGQRDVELVLAIEERVGRKLEEFEEEGVSIEGRVVRDGLKIVGEKKREALLDIEEGRAVAGHRDKKRARRAN